MENDTENTVADGYCGGSGADGGYELIAGGEVVTVVPRVWPEVGWGVAGGESKWRQRNSENFKMMKPWKSMD